MRLLLLVLLVLLTAPAALAQKPADDKPDDAAYAAASSLVGTWSYVVRPDDPVAESTFTIVQHGDQLSGTFMTDAPRDILPFDGAADPITFMFKQPGMGDIVVRGTLAGDSFVGEAQPEGQDALPFVATRQTDTADQ